MQPVMPFKLHSVQNVSIIEFASRSLDETSRLDELSKYLHDLVDRQGHRRIILDFSNVQFLASSALGIIVSLQHKIEYQKGRLAICGLRKELFQVFKFSHLDRLLTFHEARDKALASFDHLSNNQQ